METKKSKSQVWFQKIVCSPGNENSQIAETGQMTHVLLQWNYINLSSPSNNEIKLQVWMLKKLFAVLETKPFCPIADTGRMTHILL